MASRNLFIAFIALTALVAIAAAAPTEKDGDIVAAADQGGVAAAKDHGIFARRFNLLCCTCLAPNSSFFYFKKFSSADTNAR